MAKGKWAFVRESFSALTLYPVPAATGPLDSLSGKSITVLADLENLNIGARQLDADLSFEALATLFRDHTSSCRLMGFVTTGTTPNDLPPGLASMESWELVANDTPKPGQRIRREQSTNSDELLLFSAGTILEKNPSEFVAIGSGDGKLVCSLARFIKKELPATKVISVSLAGSSSNQIDSRVNADIAFNVFIGLDCLTPLP